MLRRNKNFTDLSIRQRKRRIEGLVKGINSKKVTKEIGEQHIYNNDVEPHPGIGEEYFLLENQHNRFHHEIDRDVFSTNNSNIDSDYISSDSEDEYGHISDNNYSSESDDNDTTIDNDVSVKKNDAWFLIALWANECKIKQNALSKLLKSLKICDLESIKNLPSDARTLMHTPAKKVQITELPSGGTYFHHGIERGIKEQLKNFNVEKIVEVIRLLKSMQTDLKQMSTTLKKIDDLSNEVEVLKALVAELTEISAEKNTQNLQSSSSRFDLLPDQPISSVQELNAFEQQIIQNQNIKKQLYNRTKYLGGKSVDDAIKRILKELITVDLQKKYTWTGQKTPNKEFKMCDKKFADVIVRAVVEVFDSKPRQPNESLINFTYVQSRFGEVLRRCVKKTDDNIDRIN